VWNQYITWEILFFIFLIRSYGIGMVLHWDSTFMEGTAGKTVGLQVEKHPRIMLLHAPGVLWLIQSLME
jgi:hypothetical protein